MPQSKTIPSLGAIVAFGVITLGCIAPATAQTPAQAAQEAAKAATQAAQAAAQAADQATAQAVAEAAKAARAAKAAQAAQAAARAAAQAAQDAQAAARAAAQAMASTTPASSQADSGAAVLATAPAADPVTAKAVTKTPKTTATSESAKDCTCGNKLVNGKDLSMYTFDFLKSCKGTLSKDSCKSEIQNITNELSKRKPKALDQALTIMPDKFGFHFNAGYVFTSVNNLWSKGNPRVSLGLYRTFSSKYDECHENEKLSADHKELLDITGNTPKDPNCTNLDPVNNRVIGFHYYGWQLASQIKLTDTAEQTAIAVGTATKLGPQRALDFEISPIFPFYTDNVSMYGKLRREYWGLEALWGAKKVDTDNLMITRRYFGLRTFVSAESYVDLMLGRSQRANGTRLLIRGQMPFNFPDTDQIVYLGLQGNIAMNDRTSPTARDTIRGYVTWDIDNLFSQFASK